MPSSSATTCPRLVAIDFKNTHSDALSFRLCSAKERPPQDAIEILIKL